MEWILLTSQEEMLEYIEVHKDEPVTYFCTSFNTSRHLITDETELTYTIIDSDGYTVTTCKEWANNRVHELLHPIKQQIDPEYKPTPEMLYLFEDVQANAAPIIEEYIDCWA